MLIENLEARRHLTVSLNASTHLLTITGTAGNDTITLHVTGSTLKVTDDGIVHSYVVSSVKKILAYGKAGADHITLDATINMPATIYADGLGTSNTSSGYDSVTGGSGPDLIYGGAKRNAINGGEGNDRIHGGKGENNIHGGPGDDILYNENRSTDLFNGDSGINTLDYSSSTIPVNVGNAQELRDAGEHLAGAGAGSSYSEFDWTENFNNFVGGSGNDIIVGTEFPGILKGGPGADLLRPLGPQQQVYGGVGVDKVSYATLDYTPESVHVTLDDIANDGYAGSKSNIHSDVEQIEGGDGDDYLVGNAADNVIIGGRGRDQMYGGAGNDILYARESSDPAVDYLNGGTGTDKARVGPGDFATGIEIFLS